MVKHYPYRYRDFSLMAAEASLAAGDQGRFREMHALLLERSPKLDRESLIALAKELRLDVPRFTKDLDAVAHKKEIDRDLKLAEGLDLYTTPTIFVNGIKIVGDRPFEVYKAAIDGELKASGARGTKK